MLDLRALTMLRSRARGSSSVVFPYCVAAGIRFGRDLPHRRRSAGQYLWGTIRRILAAQIHLSEGKDMRSILAKVLSFLAHGLLAVAQTLAQSPAAGPYKVLKTAKVGGEGGYDYIFADVKGRRLYVPRGGPNGQVMVFDLDTLASVGAVVD